MLVIKCKYCGSRINEHDKVCSQCGANTIEAVKEALLEEENRRKKEMADKEAKVKESLKQFTSKSKMFLILPFVIIALTVGIMIIVAFSMFSKRNEAHMFDVPDIVIDNNHDENNTNNKENEIVQVGFNEEASNDKYGFIVTKYDKYEMISDFKGYTTGVKKDGYNQIAFYVKLTNKTSNRLLPYNKVVLLADGIQMEESELSNLNGFRHEKNKKKFDELEMSNFISSNASVAGYIGFYVKQDAKEIELRFMDKLIVKFDNPYLSK